VRDVPAQAFERTGAGGRTDAGESCPPRARPLAWLGTNSSEGERDAFKVCFFKPYIYSPISGHAVHET
jgi:hypothetical protein